VIKYTVKYRNDPIVNIKDPRSPNRNSMNNIPAREGCENSGERQKVKFIDENK
jgi:hypothetical protein